MKAFSLSRTQLGLGATVFFVVYAIGQCVSGQLADNIGPKNIVIIGLSSSIIINVLMSIGSGAVLFFVVLWGCNGFFQSLGWSPNVKIVSTWFKDQKKGKSASILSTSYIIGGALSWIFAGLMVKIDWRGVFWGPAIGGSLVLIIWIIFARERPGGEEIRNGFFYTFTSVIKNKRVWIAGVSLCGLNIVRYGFLIWGPSFFFENYTSSISLAAFKSLVFPFCGALGVIITGYIPDKNNNKQSFFAFILTLILCLSIILFIVIEYLPIRFVLLASIGFTTFSPHMLLVGKYPMIMGTAGNTASLCGFIDGLGYIGAALSGIVSGFFIDVKGWNFAFTFWIIGAFIAGVFILLLNRVKVE